MHAFGDFVYSRNPETATWINVGYTCDTTGILRKDIFFPMLARSERDAFSFFYPPPPSLPCGGGTPGVAVEAPKRSRGSLPSSRGAVGPRAARGGVQNRPSGG